mmetsp:Transcript_34411/g.52691  ORF Transcript_34411/g.52691 Transcript_34411/m.52691 type:complete len:218 (+) Transcript_34411:1111-1764(+)
MVNFVIHMCKLEVRQDLYLIIKSVLSAAFDDEATSEVCSSVNKFLIKTGVMSIILEDLRVLGDKFAEAYTKKQDKEKQDMKSMFEECFREMNSQVATPDIDFSNPVSAKQSIIDHIGQQDKLVEEEQLSPDDDADLLSKEEAMFFAIVDCLKTLIKAPTFSNIVCDLLFGSRQQMLMLSFLRGTLDPDKRSTILFLMTNLMLGVMENDIYIQAVLAN